MGDVEVPVLIVGGSLVGLSTALFLAHHGVEALAVERHDGTAIHPRAGHFHLRTLELLRSVGLEEPVRRLSEEQFFPNGGINLVHTLAGGEVDSFIPDLNDGVSEFSPSRRLFVAQDALEPLLRKRAEELGATLRYGTEAVSVEQDATGVTAVLRDRATGTEDTVRAQYLVAGDGSRSPLRTQLGIGMHGFGLLSRSATIYFKADCEELLDGNNLGVIYVFNDAMRGFFRFERSGRSGFLAVNTLGDPTQPGALDVTANLTVERCVDLVRAAVGVPDLAVEIPDVAHWQATADVAERYREGRIFLAGDAAHALPPNGGFGGNTGVQDAHNLAWKLALVVKGVAGERLLDSYDAERRPVGQLTIEQAFSRYTRRLTPEFLTDDVPPLVDDFSMEIGYRYHSSAVLSEDPQDRAVVGHPREVCGRPGTRAPHVPVDGRSTLDWYGRDLVLLGGPGWCAAAEPPVQAYPVSEPVAAAHDITEDGAVLIRPDGFVAWRSRAGAADPGAALRRAVGALLHTEVDQC